MRLEPKWLAPFALACAGAAPSRLSGTLTLPFDAPFVEARIDGAPVRLRVAFDAAGPVALSPAAVARLGLRPQAASLVLVGPVRLPGGSREAVLATTEGEMPVRIVWNQRAPTDDPADIDGVVSPGALPYARVRLVRAGPAGRRAALPVRYGPLNGLAGKVPGTGIELRFAPRQPDTIATAAAGAALAADPGGRLAKASPSTRRIAYGVDRPVARLALRRPLAVAGRSIDRLLVRTADFGDPTTPPTAGNPDEIIVTGRNGSAARLRLTLGADMLGGCTLLEWSATARRITLDCP